MRPGIREMWQKVQPQLEALISQYHGPVSNSLLQINAYLRNPTSGVAGRRFMVVLSPACGAESDPGSQL